jgi:hypothetical protein
VAVVVALWVEVEDRAVIELRPELLDAVQALNLF